MNKLILSIVLMASLVGCGSAERSSERVVASFSGYSIICIQGVEYIQFTSGSTVKYNTDGTISTCSKPET